MPPALVIGNNKTTDMFLENSYDGEVQEILFPTDNTNWSRYEPIYQNQFYYPTVAVLNNSSFADLNAVDINAIVTDAAGIIVYQTQESVQIMLRKGDTVLNGTEPTFMDGGAPIYDGTYFYTFEKPMSLPSSGQYTLTVTIDEGSGDPNLVNNTKEYTFTVLPSITGTITVPSASFPTIESVISQIYTQGVVDTLNVVISPGTYNIGSNTSDYALELMSGISGFNTTEDLVRFIPSLEAENIRGSIIINFRSASGIGMYIASSLESSYEKATVNKLRVSYFAGMMATDFYKFNGRITFDGGKYKAIRFRMAPNLPATANNRIPIFIGQGVDNITINNCIIENQSIPNPVVPTLLYDAKFNSFVFDDVSEVSSGVLVRSVLPVDHNNINVNYLDTLVNNNINITNNHFYGGSYGIISLGIGPLYNIAKGYYVGYYNQSNNFSNNIITNQDICGIFTGYEEAVRINNNHIYNLGETYQGSNDIAGIMLGGNRFDNTDTYPGTTGYNNINVTMDGNEIHHIYSNSDAYGIKAEQVLNNFVYSQVRGDIYFTNHNDAIKYYNNVI